MSTRNLLFEPWSLGAGAGAARRFSASSRALAWTLLLAIVAAPAFASLQSANPQRYLEDVKVLAADNMEGRGAGTKGLQRASQYIEREFKSLGLQPAGDRSSFLQRYTLTTGARVKGANHAVVRQGGSEKRLVLNRDYTPLSFSSAGSASGSLLFAGYGITADEFQYDDYFHLDVKDKIVVVLRNEPKGFEEKSRQERTAHAAIFSKAINAHNHGAKAMILVNGEMPGNESELIKFGRLAGPEELSIPIIQVTNAVMEEWLKPSGKSLSELQRGIDSDSKPRSFAFPDSTRVTLTVSIEKTHATVANVLGYLPGKTGEYIIIGAHYDHLGRGDVSSLAPNQIGQIHHGADDNASGTAGVMELARIFSRDRGQLERGILFMAFSGEELGLLGSAHWVSHPTLPLDKAVAMINMDMIGRVQDSKLYIGGVGTGSSFKSTLEGLSKKYKFEISYSIGGYASSDHTSFVGKKIPVLFFFSGLHSDYHKPSDTWDKINTDSAVQVVNLVAEVADSIDTGARAPEFVAVEAEQPHGAAVSGGGGGYGPYFGSIPDFGEHSDGVSFSDVRPGSPAAKAGLKAGDVLVQFGDKQIRNLYEFTDALRRSRVGDIVEVKVLRGGQPVTATVTLEQRR